jgi:hypothetical protein
MTSKQKEWFDKIVYLNPITKSRVEATFSEKEASADGLGSYTSPQFATAQEISG